MPKPAETAARERTVQTRTKRLPDGTVIHIRCYRKTNPRKRRHPRKGK